MKNQLSDFSIFQLVKLLLSDDKQFAFIILLYGVVVSILTLSVPLSVQMLIETVTNTGSQNAVITLAILLLGLLLLSAVFASLQLYIVELFERRFYSRICSEITARTLHANPKEIQSFNVEELQNRYFEIMTIQGRLPVLLIGGLTLVETTVVGFLIVSFYHPFFLIFLASYSLLIFLIWLVVHRAALRTSLENSTDKYSMASWLETLAKNNSFFRGEKKLNYAIKKSQELNHQYLDSHRRHFNYIIFQNIGFLILYAIASAGLLGLGGLLVIQNQLTIGQLVAAELVLSFIFFGLSRLGFYLEIYYEICAALKKLSAFFELELEKNNTTTVYKDWNSSLKFEELFVNDRNQSFYFDFTFSQGSASLVTIDKSIISKLFIDLVLGFQEPEKGHIWYGDLQKNDLDIQNLRDDIVVVDNLFLPEGTISEYLKISDKDITHADIINVLEKVELKGVVDNLPLKLEQVLMPNGNPLSSDEVIRLKIAQAILSKPKILILSQLFDVLQVKHRIKILNELKNINGLTLIHLSNRLDLDLFDQYFYLESNQTHRFENMDQLLSYDLRAKGEDV